MAEDASFLLRTATNSPVVADTRRARELYRHVEPQHLLPKVSQQTANGNTETPASTLRDALEPYVQLASLRCNTQRAFIALIDRESQYFLAEASRPVNAESSNAFQGKENLLWAGCDKGVEKAGTLCEMTIQLSPSASRYPLFEVQDLTQDARFSRLPFVQGEPHFRFYAGTPLTTKKGINIGSLCVMDTEVREGLNLEQTGVLGWLAGLVVAHLETNREAIEGRRSKLMSKGLNFFVHGRSKIKTSANGGSRAIPVQLDFLRRNQSLPIRSSRNVVADHSPDSAANRQHSAGSPRDLDLTVVNGTLEHGLASAKDRVTSSSDPSSEEENLEGKSRDVSGNHKFTLDRAANILRECFQMEDSDGVVFVEAGTGLTHADVGPKASTNEDLPAQITKERTTTSDDDLASPTSQIGTKTSYDPSTGAFTRLTRDPAHILASSTNHEPILQGQYPAGCVTLAEIDQTVLHQLFERYPHGKIWYLANGSVASSSEDDKKRKYSTAETLSPRKPSQQRNWETNLLVKLFPEARQILFAPMWDAAASRWASGCFVWRASETRIFSTTIELSFLNAFSKTVMTECSRLDTLLADKQKADFIGSISHELRSPLHGILAGAEFLSETATSDFQRSLIDTIEACGRTLLDTINHVLDFSKINSLDRNWRNTRQSRKRSTEGQIGQGAQFSAKQPPGGDAPLLPLYAVTDIAAITEEVVEGLSIGQIYTQATDLTDGSAAQEGQRLNKGLPLGRRTRQGREDEKPTTTDTVEVLLDIVKEDWIFMAQSGAIRRVIMNLFGNAVKYTSSGTIKVELRLESVADPKPDHEGRMVLLRISDTGNGIDTKFLTSRLFVPFAQENTLSPGTGLGMSIVRSIVTMMGGHIDVRSRVGEGTTVQVSLPLVRPTAGSAPTASPSQSVTSTGATHDDSIRVLRDEAAGWIVSICGHAESGHIPIGSRKYTKILANYVKNWYELEVCDWTERDKANVWIVEEKDIPEVLSGDEKTGLKGSRALIVLCSNATRHSEAQTDSSQSQLRGVVVHISKPCGPYKLAKAFRTCLGQARLLQSTHLPSKEESSALSGHEALKAPVPPPIEGQRAQKGVQNIESVRGSQVTQQPPMTLDEPSSCEKQSGDEFPVSLTRAGSIASPLSPEVQNLSRWNDTAPNAVLPKAEQSGPHILLVDDNKINLQLLQTFMLKRKYRFVDSAEDGRVAVDAVKAAEKPYDLIFMDISMPVMNGFEATRAIRLFEAEQQLEPATIIALTGLANSRDEAEGLSAGCDIYMTKPASFKELAKLLQSCDARLAAMPNPGG